jgi:hypothetical protein
MFMGYAFSCVPPEKKKALPITKLKYLVADGDRKSRALP